MFFKRFFFSIWIDFLQFLKKLHISFNSFNTYFENPDAFIFAFIFYQEIFENSIKEKKHFHLHLKQFSIFFHLFSNMIILSFGNHFRNHIIIDLVKNGTYSSTLFVWIVAGMGPLIEDSLAFGFNK